VKAAALKAMIMSGQEAKNVHSEITFETDKIKKTNRKRSKEQLYQILGFFFESEQFFCIVE